tara:strand:- start:907 stop:1260 length:354 start_codon:yes stop_codon:yes gene_type:complete
MSDQAKYLAEVLRENQNMPFVKRINDPGAYGVIDNDDGSQSTHRMSAEIDEQGQAWAYPNIVDTPEGLKQFGDTWEAMRYNIESGNAIPFPDIDTALDFSKNYKTPEFNEYYEGKRK